MGPTTMTRNGKDFSFTTAGISILTKNKYESTAIQNGEFSATHAVHDKDETSLPRYKAQAEAARAAGSGIKSVAETLTK